MAESRRIVTREVFEKTTLRKMAYQSLLTNSIFKIGNDLMHPMIAGKIMRQFLQAVIHDEDALVRQLLDKHPELLMMKAEPYEKKKFVIESKHTWLRQRLDGEDALGVAVKKKQIKMIGLLLSYYNKLEQTEGVVKAKTESLSKWSDYKTQKNKNGEEEIVIPQEYSVYIQSLIDVFITETFPNGINIENQLSDHTEETLNFFRKRTLPIHAVRLDDYFDPELFLYAFYKIYVTNFQRFQDWAQRDHFCVKVGGWIQSLLSPETAKKLFCASFKENGVISARAEFIEFLDNRPFYRLSRDSLSSLGGKYLRALGGDPRGDGRPLSVTPSVFGKAMLKKSREFSELYAATIAAKSTPSPS